MEYLYYLANASLTLRLIEYLHSKPHLSVNCVTVINQIDGWVVNVKIASAPNSQEDGDIRALLNELGIAYAPPQCVTLSLASLTAGQSPVEVMRRYQVVIVAHGSPQRQEIEAFRQQFISGLGYCPPTLA